MMNVGRREGRGRVAKYLLLSCALQTTWAASSSAEPVPIEVASRDQKQAARKQMQLGIDLFKAEKYEEALEMLRMSHEKVASPNTRLMIANALAKLERYPEAYTELQLVIEEAEPLALGESKYEKTVAAAKAVLDSIADKLAFVELDVQAKVLLNGEPLTPDAEKRTLALLPGKATLEFDAGEGHSKRVELDLEAGKTESVVLQLEPPAPPPAAPEPAPAKESTVVEVGVPYRTLAWTGVGVAGAGAIGFAVLGVMASGRHDQLQEECNGTLCNEPLRDVAEEGRTLQMLANVSLGVGVVGLVGATVFFLAGDDAPSASGVEVKASNEPEPRRARRQASAGSVETVLETTRVEVGLGALQVRGQF